MGKVGEETVEKERAPYFASFMKRIGGVFLAPDETFNHIIADRIGFWEPLILMILLVAIQGAVLASFAYRVFSAIASSIGALTSGGLGLGFLNFILVTMIFAMIIMALIAWIIMAGIAHISAKYLFKGDGSFVQLLKLYGYTLTPISLVILGTMLFSVSWATWPLTLFFQIIATFWIVFLMATAVKHNYKIDSGKAFISSFIGPMVIWLVCVGIAWTWMWLLIHSATGGLI